ncbi:hypothetical protein GC163_19540 [bacterium]|nr:hypothetical protein [bacterium]
MCYRFCQWAVFVGSLCLIGCGRGEIERFPIAGAVQLDGRPLKAGRIVFTPIESTKGPAASGGVIDGFFEIPKMAGAVPGEYRVEIEGQLDLGFPIDDDVAFSQNWGAKPLPPNPVPKKYNRESELKATVTTDPVSNRFDFDLRSNADTRTANK